MDIAFSRAKPFFARGFVALPNFRFGLEARRNKNADSFPDNINLCDSVMSFTEIRQIALQRLAKLYPFPFWFVSHLLVYINVRQCTFIIDDLVILPQYMETKKRAAKATRLDVGGCDRIRTYETPKA